MQIVNWNKQALLAGALLVLGTTAYWLEFKHKPEQETKEEASKKLFSLKDVQIKEVLIHDGTGHIFDILCSDTTATLCKPGDNSKWELSQPSKLKADDSNANALISALNNLSVSESIDLKEETPEKRAALLKEYGLDAQARGLPGTRKIEVISASGTMVVYLGLSHPIGDNIFGVAETLPAGQKSTGKVDENKVYLVPTYFKANFEHDLTYWRDKKVLTAAPHEIAQFSLKGPKTEVQGERKDGRWTLKNAKDGEFAGDIENVDNLITAATFLSAKSFTSDNKNDEKAKTALKGAKEIVALTVQQEKGAAKETPAPITLTLYQKGTAKPTPPKKGAPATPAPGTQLYATVSNLDPLYELEPNALDRLNKETKDLRLTKLITSMERFTFKKIEISGKPLGSAPIVLKDKDGNWNTEGSTIPTAGEKVQNLLDKLSGNRIQEFLASSAIPSGENDGLTVNLADDKGDTKRQLLFWKNAGKLYSRDLNSKRKEAFLVDAATIDALPWTHDFFEQKPPAPPQGGPGAPIAPGLHGGPGGPGMPPGAPGLPPGLRGGPQNPGGPGMPPGSPGMPPGAPSAMPGAPPEPGKALIPQPPQKKPANTP